MKCPLVFCHLVFGIMGGTGSGQASDKQSLAKKFLGFCHKIQNFHYQTFYFYLQNFTVKKLESPTIYLLGMVLHTYPNAKLPFSRKFTEAAIHIKYCTEALSLTMVQFNGNSSAIWWKPYHIESAFLWPCIHGQGGRCSIRCLSILLRQHTLAV